MKKVIQWFMEKMHKRPQPKEESIEDVQERAISALKDFRKVVENTICSGYWNGDITDYMKSTIFGPHHKINTAFCEAILKIKGIEEK